MGLALHVLNDSNVSFGLLGQLNNSEQRWGRRQNGRGAYVTCLLNDQNVSLGLLGQLNNSEQRWGS